MSIEIAEKQSHVGDSDLYIRLNRNEINDFIRTLRKARDRMFGSDA